MTQSPQCCLAQCKECFKGWAQRGSVQSQTSKRKFYTSGSLLRIWCYLGKYAERDSLSLNRDAYFVYQEGKSGVSEYVNMLSSSKAGKRANIKKKNRFESLAALYPLLQVPTSLGNKRYRLTCSELSQLSSIPLVSTAPGCNWDAVHFPSHYLGMMLYKVKLKINWKADFLQLPQLLFYPWKLKYFPARKLHQLNPCACLLCLAFWVHSYSILSEWRFH